jgi:FKBP-type peptidyl-prolyl cis-trans isomerase
MRKLRLAVLFVFFISTINAQTMLIPGSTGYAVPAESYKDQLFSETNGLQNWVNTKQQINYFFHVSKPGILQIKINAKNAFAGSIINLLMNGKDFKVAIPKSNRFQLLNVGSLSINDTGFYQISISGIKQTNNTIADIQSIELLGTAAKGIHANQKPRRNAASVHLKYPLADSIKATTFYNEITVPMGADIVHSYYMACGFSRGYFGIQVNSPTERRIIFSVWDAGKEAIDRNKVADSNKVQLLAKGENVFADGFGNEGTGGHSHLVYNWKAGEKYQLMVTALPDSASTSTIYTGYFFMPELQKWKLIASFKAPHDGETLRKLYSFNENFVGVNGQLERKALFGNQWIQQENGRWMELTKANFSYDATGKAKDRIDYGAGVENGQFYLRNGGFKESNAQFGDLIERAATKQRPVIDWFKNADSLAQATKDNELIQAYIKKMNWKPTGSKEGVYYEILKEGAGANVKVTDTVTVHYKGSLLSDGSIFDQTKEKPATFPLNRLIKGWQIGVPMCRVGGTIRIVIPSGLAYTIRSRSKLIPPNSVLVFDIEVVKSN